MITVTKIFEFEAAHHLPGYDGDCKRLHGHSYKLEVTVSGEVNEKTGMVMDFKLLKEIVQERVINQFDHQLLNDHIKNPTAENIVNFIVKELDEAMCAFFLCVDRVRLWETSNSYCEWIK
jgi:6-pyruvoyltetrahydropterin/6-carboxytetrahydropterin synthase